ncbi:F0F1-type ATP synthase assembly protein I [Nocardioides daedukensis]|uniref:F0F1-type ATP synthase assembly protein I n=1 Tax=Nocardioides daedukensis TaxID=634462 RepID=A0A7Y9UW49_9ACTN|nr:AtpZ/AtpI family protein [Nocardioides daedukensis]NYG60585.1 F0F1-type ATP synthase assembly protein I [Nocardioides daedukensis]
MAQQKPPTAHTDKGSGEPQGDPWHAFGYITSGVFVYGALGWGLDRWLGTSYLVAIGILLGAVFGIYMTWARFRPTSTDQK